jgi:hypothetical protein
MVQDFSESLAKEAFLRLVELQDEGIAVTPSRQLIAKRFGLTEEQVKQIEKAGLVGKWPPFTD